MSADRRPSWTVFATAAAVLTLDIVSKALVRATLDGQPPIELIPGVFRLRYVTNTGGAFGLSQSTPWFFAAAAMAVSIWIVIRALRGVEATWLAVGMGLVLGGALGNLVERAAGGLDMSGAVTDFLDVGIWPVFNLADSAIVVGAIVLGFALSRRGADEPAP